MFSSTQLYSTAILLCEMRYMSIECERNRTHEIQPSVFTYPAVHCVGCMGVFIKWFIYERVSLEFMLVGDLVTACLLHGLHMNIRIRYPNPRVALVLFILAIPTLGGILYGHRWRGRQLEQEYQRERSSSALPMPDHHSITATPSISIRKSRLASADTPIQLAVGSFPGAKNSRNAPLTVPPS